MPSIYYSGVVVTLILNVALLSSFPLSGEASASLCPKKKPGDPQKLYYNETNKCYKEFSKGPCPKNMVIVPFFPNQYIGECDCSINGLLPFVYSPQKDECFELYTQAYCSVGMWLVPNKRNEPECRKNPCLSVMSNDTDEPTVWFKKRCVKYYTRSPSLCPNPSDTVIIPKGSLRPECINNVTEQSLTNVKRLACRPGSRRDVTGKCVATVAVTIDDDDEP